MGRRLNAELRRELAGQVVGERPQVARWEQQVGRQRRRLADLLHTDEVELQQARGARVQVDREVRVRVVDEHDLGIGRCHRLDRDAVVLLLVDQLDAVGHARAGVFEIRGVVNQNGPHSRAVQAHQGACGAKGFFDGADRPVDDLVDGAENRQPLGIPRVDHLVESHQGVLRHRCRRRFSLGQHTQQPQRPVDLIACGVGRHVTLLRRLLLRPSCAARVGQQGLQALLRRLDCISTSRFEHQNQPRCPSSQPWRRGPGG